MNCRFCKTELNKVFVDLVNSPASNSFLSQEQLDEPETFYPLKIYVCDECKLVQIDEYKKSDDIFNKDYAYFSSFSTSWLEHAKSYVEKISDKLSLNQNSLVTEIASNDGYLLQYFVESGIPCIGIEPTSSTAKVAKEKGIDVIEDFFGSNLATTLEKSDLILGNNVLAHVPDINDFVSGLKTALKENGTITMEFPHLLNIIKDNQFDTIYHEHFSSEHNALSDAGLGFNSTIKTYGLSLRIDHILYSQHFGIIDAQTIEPLGGDHIPVMATLVVIQ